MPGIRFDEIGSNMVKVRLGKKVIYNNLLKYVLISVGMVFVLGCALLFWIVATEPVPQLIPLDDPDATYTITRSDNSYIIHYVSTGEQSRDSFVGKDARVFIASSPVSLEAFVDSQVVLEGKFISTEKQCIQEECTQTAGSFVGLEIDSIRWK